MSDCIIYHNPRCSKSRQTLALLQQRDLDITTIVYLESPPSVEELDRLCCALDIEPLGLMRIREQRFTELGLDKNDQRSRKEWLQLLADNPILMERPIVVVGEKVAIGRPPENVLNILQD
ncbi:MAG TPA: arsenate reductase (glutaredoxin) [Acidiferrobacteraceae bacterium]|nr:arsenate reductase (glutaredoxin) [Acidiferrobacteraceae bacterium]HEX19933.1 arsenate reductase (glutaredoxin) [Acidiferrobacteraceae bacterium]